MKKAVLLMAHGAPQGLDEVEEYVSNVRHGRPLAPELMSTIKERYRRVGASPLIQWTFSQANALHARIKERHPEIGQVYVGMRHSHPFIQEAVSQMITDGIESVIALCMAPQDSRFTVGAYQKALEDAIANRNLQYSLIRSYTRHNGLIRAFVSRLNEARQNHPESLVIFTAHSLPERTQQEGDMYDFEVKETARLVALSAGLKDWRFAYQSQGMSSEKWLGPSVEERIEELFSRNISEILVMPIGFVCDHVEILYDIDIMHRQYAEKKGMKLHRVPSLNDSSEFIDLLYQLVNERL